MILLYRVSMKRLRQFQTFKAWFIVLIMQMMWNAISDTIQAILHKT